MLVVLHGGPGLSHDYLTDLFTLASSELRVVLYDQRGVGRSTGTVDGDILARQVDDLAAVQESFGAARIHLLGHSAGGLTIALTARHRPEAIASAVFVESTPTTRPALDAVGARFEARVGELAGAGVIALPADQGDGTAMARAALPAYFHDPHHPRARDHGGMTLTGDVYTAFLTALGDYDLSDGLSTLRLPSLVYACSVPFTTAMGLSVTEALPAEHTTTVVLDNCGHLTWIEQPDRFLPPLRTFLAAATGNDAGAVAS